MMPSPCRLGPGRTCRGTSEGTLQSWPTTWRSRWTRCSRRGSTWSPQILVRTGGTYPTRCSFFKTSNYNLQKTSFAQKVIIFILILIIILRNILHNPHPSQRVIISNCNSWKLLSSRGWGWRTVDRRGSLRTTTRRRMGGAGWTSLTICNTFLIVRLVYRLLVKPDE